MINCASSKLGLKFQSASHSPLRGCPIQHSQGCLRESTPGHGFSRDAAQGDSLVFQPQFQTVRQNPRSREATTGPRARDRKCVACATLTHFGRLSR
jgi:hypothetical protein